MGPRSKGGASPLSLKLKKPQAAGKIQCLGRMGELMRLYHQERATRGRVPFARRVLPAEKEKAADSQLIILMWKAEGFLLASDFSEELSKTFSSQLVSTWGERCGEGGRPGCCQGAPAPSPGFALQNLPCKRAHYPLGKGTFGICPDCWAIYIETRRKLLRSLRRKKRGENKKTGPPGWENQAGSPALSRRVPWTSTVRVV